MPTVAPGSRPSSLASPAGPLSGGSLGLNVGRGVGLGFGRAVGLGEESIGCSTEGCGVEGISPRTGELVGEDVGSLCGGATVGITVMVGYNEPVGHAEVVGYQEADGRADSYEGHADVVGCMDTRTVGEGLTVGTETTGACVVLLADGESVSAVSLEGEGLTVGTETTGACVVLLADGESVSAVSLEEVGTSVTIIAGEGAADSFPCSRRVSTSVLASISPLNKINTSRWTNGIFSRYNNLLS